MELMNKLKDMVGLGEKEVAPEQRALTDAGDFVNNFYSTYSTPLQPYKEKIKTWHKIYKCIPEPRKHGLANTFVPESYIAVEVLVADIMGILFGYDPFFTSEPEICEREEHKVMMERLIWQLMLNASFKRKALRFIRGLGIEGSKPCYVFFEKKWNNKVRDKVFNKQTGETKIDIVPRLVKNYPDFSAPDVIDMYADPFSNELPAVMFKWRKSWEDIQDLVRQNRARQDLVNRAKDIKSKETTTKQEDSIKEQKQKNAGFDGIDKEKIANEAELRVYFGNVKRKYLEPSLYDSDEGDEEILGEILQCNGMVIGINENGYFDYENPVIQAKWVELDDELFCPSAISVNEKTQLELNTTRDQELDFKTFSLYNIWIKSRQADINNDQLKIAPEQIIECNGDARAALSHWRPDPAAFQAGGISEGVMKDDIRRSTGATSTRQGISERDRQTAREVEMMQQRGGLRSYLIAMTIAETWLKPLLRKYWYLIKQNVDNPVKILGKDGYIVKPDSIYGDYEWIPKCLTDPLNIVTLQNSILGLMENLGRIPEVAGPALYNLGKKFYELRGGKDSEKIFPPKPGDLIGNPDPEKENEMLKQGTIVRAYPYQDQIKHLETHIPARKAEKDETSIRVMDDHIRQHFELTQVLQKMQGSLDMSGGVTPPARPQAAAPATGGMSVNR